MVWEKLRSRGSCFKHYLVKRVILRLISYLEIQIV